MTVRPAKFLGAICTSVMARSVKVISAPSTTHAPGGDQRHDGMSNLWHAVLICVETRGSIARDSCHTGATTSGPHCSGSNPPTFIVEVYLTMIVRFLEFRQARPGKRVRHSGRRAALRRPPGVTSPRSRHLASGATSKSLSAQPVSGVAAAVNIALPVRQDCDEVQEQRGDLCAVHHGGQLDNVAAPADVVDHIAGELLMPIEFRVTQGSSHLLDTTSPV